MPWLISEDRAIKAKLTGLTVTDANAPTGRPVPVRYLMPESELTNQTFPLIVIEHAGVEIDHEREHRGFSTLPYAPEGYAPWWQPADDHYDVTKSPYGSEYPIPYDIRYHIMVFSRLSWHDIALASSLAQPAFLPARFGYLEIPDDLTVRRLDLLGGPELSTERDENGKRLFKRDYLVSISSEMLPSQVVTYAQATSVTLDSVYYQDGVSVPQNQIAPF